MVSHKSGFTLIELMVAVAIVGVLASIAYPSYTAMVRKSNRTDATSELNNIAIRLQRCYTTYNTFDPAEGKCDVIDQLKVSTGVKSQGGFDVIKGSDFDKTTYTLTATPITGTVQALDTDCSSFSLKHTGERIAVNGSSADTTSSCWK